MEIWKGRRKRVQLSIVAALGIWSVIGTAQAAGWVDRRYPENTCRWSAQQVKPVTCKEGGTGMPLVKKSEIDETGILRVASLPPESTIDQVSRRPSLSATRK